METNGSRPNGVYWQRMLLKGRLEAYWSFDDTTVHVHGEARRVLDIVQSMRDLHGGGPVRPEMKEPRFGHMRPAKPHPGQTEMEIANG